MLTFHIKRFLPFKKLATFKTIWYKNKRTMYSNEAITHKEQMQVVDLRSDTLTKPNALMRKAMFEAEVGDDVMGEDPTVMALEKKAASLLGKEAALFVPSGTMANLIAIMRHCNQRGSEIIVGDSSHIFKYEQGNSAQIAGVQLRTLPNKVDGTFDLCELERNIRGDDDHEPVTALICVENTHNLCGGKALPLDWLDKLAHIANLRGIPLHMDGARLFNASVYQQVPPSRIVRDFASISFCLSKGLGAPIGSLLVGSKQFIKGARRSRKALGGGMRQVGIIAAAGLIAIGESWTERLTKDHARALKIAHAVVNLQSKKITVDIQNQHTNIILLNIDSKYMNAQEFCQRLSTVTDQEKTIFGNKLVIVRAYPKNESSVRLVTHCDLTDDDVDAAIQKIKSVIQELES
ncbi:hypothetical protein R5R35_003704 [Gryllus longicercus]|uniref:Aromatic amino acid beta-eliminating lyase/threonine aldolase domain-containing protein n=1 Tax=Gryllus longicercus TaxID=2509291 RepID=A0AAN9Z6R6_9ORTH